MLKSSQVPDLLFTGDGEAFNVGDPSSFAPEPHLIARVTRLDNS